MVRVLIALKLRCCIPLFSNN